MKFRIAGTQIQEMAAEEILDHVPASTYKRIKAADPRPVFRAYVIGHEGESTGKVVGMGRVVKNWVKAAIEGMNSKLAIGTQFFHMHGQETNDHGGRKAIAEVAGKTLSNIAGKLSAIAIAYIYPEYRDIPLDVASIEADINMPETINPNARAVDVDVSEITGIALGNSQICRPGFAGAGLLAQVQEFADNANHEKPPKEGEKPMTKPELIAAIREAKLTLSDLFSPREIADDSTVQDVIRDKRRNEDGFEGRQSAKLEAQIKKMEEDNKALQAKLDTANRATLKTRASEALKPAIEKRRLDEKQSAFILKNAAKFDPKSEDTLPGDLDKFLDAQIDDMKVYAEVYGIKAGEPGKAGVPAGKADDTSVEDLLTPDALKDAVKK
jgi:hypothetical protein